MPSVPREERIFGDARGRDGVSTLQERDSTVVVAGLLYRGVYFSSRHPIEVTPMHEHFSQFTIELDTGSISAQYTDHYLILAIPKGPGHDR